MVDTKVRVVGADGKDVAHNGMEQGDIIVKGNGVMDINNTLNQVTSDGWLYTGDKGTIDENGHIKIMDRKKDININDGANVSSVEIENVLHEHPSIQEAAIIAVPNKDQVETLHAFVVLHEGHETTEQEIMTFAKTKLDETKRPHKITFMDELPKTTSGKILKIKLAEKN